ncbi:Crp/Fnr family transcriptional regulator [Hufsiella ginkgonis]|uniref:Cyclic nucleotide-binding domain-containing protein n=1 Tax=Hufsiella ginkgonis TaxID=2695274 RepID=A0A7K1XVR5_9SPHI|nr:Crp/Fnr family transcriptional regulator [Hufsiella ginkgonis]MXV15072.1 cyclic nucleotide-binding domain-containing protein [Hufsiella ginkgonis]
MDSIRPFGQFTDEDLALFGSRLKFRSLKKNDVLLKPGATCQAIWFLQSGSLRHFSVDNNNAETIANLYLEHDWFTEFNSFTLQKPSAYFIQAFEDCEIAELGILELHHLILQKQQFFVLGKLLGVMNYPDFAGTDLSPAGKYEQLMRNKPRLLLKFPLKTLASYLKIAPETLSRVRAKVIS